MLAAATMHPHLHLARLHQPCAAQRPAALRLSFCGRLPTARQAICAPARAEADKLSQAAAAPAQPNADGEIRFGSVPVPAAPPMSGWRKRRLEAAYQAGRRNFSVKQLAGDIGIDRKQVLAWLKARAQQPDEPKAEEAGSPFGSSQVASDGAAASDEKAEPAVSTANMTFAERQVEPGGDFARKRMKRATEATLEMVFDKYRWPPDVVVAGVCQLHSEMSPSRVKLWFEQRRRASPQPAG